MLLLAVGGSWRRADAWTGDGDRIDATDAARDSAAAGFAACGGARTATPRAADEERPDDRRRRATQAITWSHDIRGMKPTVACSTAASGAAGRDLRADIERPAEREAGEADGDGAGDGIDRARRAVKGPGSTPRLLQVVDGVGEHARGHDDEERAGPREEPRRLMRSIPRASSQPSTTAATSPEQRAEQRGRRVAERLHHRPQQQRGLDASRATETKPMATSAQSPPCASARSIPPSRLAFRVRAVFCIQKIIHVTIATAMSERVPPMISCASKVSEYAPKVSTAPIASASRPPARRPPTAAAARRAGRCGDVRDEDADDQRGFEAFAQADQEGGEHGRSRDVGWLSGQDRRTN